MSPADDKKISTGRNLPPPAFPVIEGYRFLQTIARSPKSEIHVAHSTELGHNVAIKVLRTGLLSAAPIETVVDGMESSAPAFFGASMPRLTMVAANCC